MEAWATPLSAKSWQRLFDFGRTTLNGNAAVQGAGAAPGEILPTATAAPNNTQSSDNIALIINRGTTANTQRLSTSEQLDRALAIHKRFELELRV